MTPLRILKVTQVYPPVVAASGQAVKVEAISRHLRQRGHGVTVLTTARERERVVPPSEGVEVARLPPTLRYRNITVNPGAIGFCQRHLREFDVAHIYGTYDLLGPVVAAFCWRWRVPYVLEPLGMFRPIVRNVLLKRAYRRFLGWPIVWGAARIVATSDLERNELLADGVPASKVVIRRNGVDLPDFDQLPARGSFRNEIAVESGEPLVLYLGRLSRNKGLELLVKAFSNVGVPATLAIVGPDDGDGSAQEIDSLRIRLGLDGRLKILGPRFGANKFAALADADIFVLPSRSENFGNAAAEAIACGVPVIVTDRCGIAPLLINRAGLVVPCEVEAIRDALHRLITDRPLRAMLRDGTVELRQSLSWDEPIAQLERLYLEVVGGGPPPGEADF